MNTETANELNRLALQESIGSRISQDAIVRARAKVLSEGASAEDFINHPHWQKLQHDGEALEKRLLQELLKPDLTLAKMRSLQAEIKALRFLLDHPKGYLARREAELKKGRK